ncbi:hypothetical protein [Enterococcus casseliflavus]|uniref:hypothetical protein n=1 Tax=Enterococcus casseliflavus TaxID=37734 RepID=UPI00325AA3E4
MFIRSYGGQWKIPITLYNRRLYWPPSWIECDCGELAKQVYVKKGDFWYPNGHYICKVCQREYQKVDGRDYFILVNPNEE